MEKMRVTNVQGVKKELDSQTTILRLLENEPRDSLLISASQTTFLRIL